MLALLLVFHQTLNLSRNKFVVMPPSWNTLGKSTNQRAAFYNPQQMFLLHNNLIMQGEKQETSTKNLKRNTVAQQV